MTHTSKQRVEELILSHAPSNPRLARAALALLDQLQLCHLDGIEIAGTLDKTTNILTEPDHTALGADQALLQRALDSREDDTTPPPDMP